MGFLGILRREHVLAAEGIVPAPSDRALPLPAIGLFVLIASAAGLAFSADTSLLPPSLITAFFSWLARLLSSLSKPTEAVRLPQLGETMAPQMPGIPQELMGMAEQGEPWPYWDYVKYAMIGAAVFIFLWFMIHPLLSRPRLALGGLSLTQYFRRFLIRWFSARARGISSFFASLREGGSRLKIGRPSPADISRLAGDLLAGYSRAKRKDMRRSVNLFARLILWGAAYCKVVWKPSYAPGEFCALLAAAVQAKDLAAGPAVGPAVIRCGELFEKALYSDQPLTKDEGEEFKTKIEEIDKLT
jgi:hypothetical protein